MKKLVSIALVAMCLALLTIGVSAEEVAGESVEYSVEYYEDGSYCVTTITCSGAREVLQKSAKKTKSYYDSDDEVLFSLVVYGTFKYDGTSASCLSSSYTYNVYDSSWSFKSATASKSGATATASGTFVKKVLGITTMTRTLTPTLTCDKDGNLS